MFLYSIVNDFLLTFRGVLKYHFIFKRSQYWNDKRRMDYQFRKIKKLLIDCANDVPYYRSLFQELNFNPISDFNDLGDLKKIPILSKDFVKKNRAQFENKKHLRSSIKFRTSGSTGTPFEIFVHKNQWVVEQGVIWRHWKWGGYNFRDPLAMVRSFVPAKDGNLWKRNLVTNFFYFSPFHLNDENMAKYLDEMVTQNIVVLRGYPSSISTMAKFVLKTCYSVPNIKLVLTASEVLSEVDRELIEKAFSAKVSNHYGLAEQIVMMGDCEKHEGLHNYDEYGYLELLDTDDPQIKRIIGTNLNNLTTPLIRYDTGDLAVVADKPCSCGRSLPTIKNIIGRKDAVIKTIEGYEIPTTNFYTMLEHFQEIDRWQIVQKSLNDIELVFSSKNITEERTKDLEHEIRKRLNNKMSVTLSKNGNFIQKNEGKFNPFISLL